MTRYIIRLDDAHPSMHKLNWETIENIINKYKIKPIVGVIPRNRDESIKYEKNEDSNFWNKVRNWQDNGWFIAMHGYEHKLRKSNLGLIGINKFSEFVGLNLEEQRNKIKQALQIMQKEEIIPSLFMAPAHGLDKNTIKALKLETNIKHITDGFFLLPKKIDGLIFLPQQIWRPKLMFFGLWTICLHPSNMSKKDILDLEKFIKKHNKKILNNPLEYSHNSTVINMLFNWGFKFIWTIKKCLEYLKKTGF